MLLLLLRRLDLIELLLRRLLTRLLLLAFSGRPDWAWASAQTSTPTRNSSGRLDGTFAHAFGGTYWSCTGSYSR